MNKEGTLTTLDLIKAEALKIERRLEKKSKTSTKIKEISMMMRMQSIGETTTTPADKTHPAPNATIAKSQGTLRKIVGKRMINPMATEALLLNHSVIKTMQRNAHTVV